MSAYATNEVSDKKFKEFIEGMNNSYIKKYKKDIHNKLLEIIENVENENISSQILTKQMIEIFKYYREIIKRLQKNKFQFNKIQDLHIMNMSYEKIINENIDTLRIYLKKNLKFIFIHINDLQLSNKFLGNKFIEIIKIYKFLLKNKN